ncbi:MAG: hypothetical protein QUV05_13365, partial [Phycisphaerae bacterium]|nr:hypothetical protein [Phycisphaerae bacterium]
IYTVRNSSAASDVYKRQIRVRARRYTDEELIERLRSLYQNRGILSGLIINETESMPSASVYVHRFGSLIRAYQMVGFTPDRDYRYLEVNRFLRQLHPEIVAQTEARIADIGGSVVRDPATDILRVNDEFSVSLVLARCQTHDNGSHRWKVRFDTSLCPDITVAVRLDHANQAVGCCRFRGHLVKVEHGTGGVGWQREGSSAASSRLRR